MEKAVFAMYPQSTPPYVCGFLILAGPGKFLGFEPKVSLEKGLNKTIQWYEETTV